MTHAARLTPLCLQVGTPYPLFIYCESPPVHHLIIKGFTTSLPSQYRISSSYSQYRHDPSRSTTHHPHFPSVTRATTEFHGCPASGGGMVPDRAPLFFSCKLEQHVTLKKKTRDKTLESTLKAPINTKLTTCDDKGVFTDDNDRGKGKGVFRKHK